MPRRPRLSRIIAAAVITFVIAGVVRYTLYGRQTGRPAGSRSGIAERTPATPSANPSPNARTYTIRGRIEQLPDPAVKGSMLQIHHERIEDWANSKGVVKGMNSMVMPFPPAQGVSLDGFVVGDLVEFKAEFDYTRLPPQRTVSITKLPPETTLNIQAPGE